MKKCVKGGENVILKNPPFNVPSEGENIAHFLYPPKFSKLIWTSTGFGERIWAQWEFLCFAKSLMVSQF